MRRARRRSLLVCLALVVTTTSLVPTASAKDADLYGPRDRVKGKTLGEWAVEHLEWFGAEASAALNDPAGPTCVPGRSGPMILLPTLLDAEASFECTVSRHQPVFVWANGVWCWDEPDNAACASDNFDALETKSVMTVDGELVKKMDRRVVRPPEFDVIVEPASVLVNLGIIEPGAHTFALAGYAAILEPLHRGTHTVVVHTTFNDGFTLDVTFHLTSV